MVSFGKDLIGSEEMMIFHAVFLQFEGEGCSLKKELSKSAAFPLERGTREDSYFPETSPYLRTSFFRASICVLLLLCAVP
jgi:hypothetical protein